MAKKQKSNFKKAMDELLGAEMQSTEMTAEENLKQQEAKTDFEAAEKEVEAEKAIPREEAIIPADMVIVGNITTGSNIKIEGNVIGDIVCQGNILLQGKVQGNVSTGNLTIEKGNLSGDTNVTGTMVVMENSELIGNVTAQNIYTNAFIEGQLKASGIVELKKHALVKGDIYAKDISVESGARIKGLVTINE